MRACAWFVIATVVAGCALGETVRPASAPSRQAPPITIRVVRPDGAGPFPAVVWLHGCGGVVRGARHLEDWTRRLVRLGYVVAIPDSVSERGYPNGICGNGTLVPAPTRAEDAYAALRHLEGRPDVIAERIGLIGFSHGGWTVLAAMDQDAGARARAAAGATRRVLREVAIEALDEGLAGHGGDAVDRREQAGPEVRRVRDHRHPERCGERGDPAQLAHAADLGHAGLRVVDGPGLEGAAEVPDGPVVLAGRGGDAAPVPHLREPGHVLGREHRLLQPAQAERRQPSRHLDRLDDPPRTVRVEHDPRAGTGDVARGLHLRHGDLVQLDVAIAALERLLGVEGDGVRLAVAQQARVRGQVGARTAAEQPVERQPRELAGDVPERDVDAGERVDGRPVAPDTVQPALEVVVDLGDLRRVAAHAHRAEHGVDGRACRVEDPVAERLAPAADPGVGVDAHQQHVDAGHRAVAQLRRRPLDDHRQVDDKRLDARDLHGQRMLHRRRDGRGHASPLVFYLPPRGDGSVADA